MPDKIDQLYEALRKDGAVTKSRDNFRNYVLAPGDEGVQNRKALYEALKADGAVTSPTQDEFERRLEISGTQQPTAPPTTTAPNALKQQDAAASGGNKGTVLGGIGNIGNLTGAALGGAIGALQAGGQQNGSGTNDYQWSYNPPQPEPVKEQPVVQQNNGVPQPPAPTTTPTTDATQKAEDDDAKTLEFMAAANKGVNGRDISRGVDQNGNRYSKEIRGNNIIYSYDDKSVAQYVVDDNGNTKLKRYQYSNGDVDVHNDDGSVTKIEKPHHYVFNPGGEVRMKSDAPFFINPNLSKTWSRLRGSLPSYLDEYAGKSENELHDILNQLSEQSYVYDSNSAEYADLAARQNSAALQLVAKQCGFANLKEAEANQGKFDYERFKFFVATNYPCALTDKLLDGTIIYEPNFYEHYHNFNEHEATAQMKIDALNNKLQGGDYYVNLAMQDKEAMNTFYTLALGEALRTGESVDSVIKREWNKISMRINQTGEALVDGYLQDWIDATPKWLLYTGYALGNSITGGIGKNLVTDKAERHQLDMLFNKYQSTLSGGEKFGADMIGLVADLPLYMLASEGAGALIGPEALAASGGARVLHTSLTMTGVGLVGQGVQDWSAGEFSGIGQWLGTTASHAATGATMGAFGEAARGVMLRPTSKMAVLWNKGAEYAFETAGFTLPEWVSTVYSGVTPEGDPITGDYFWHSAVHNLGVVIAMKGRRNFKNWKPVVNKTDLAQLQAAYPDLYNDVTHNLDMVTRGKGADELSDSAKRQLAQLQDDMNTPGKGVSWTTYKKTMNLFGFEVVPPRPSSVRVEGNVVQVLDSGGNVITEKKCANTKAATQERDKLHSQIEHDTERVNAQCYDASRREMLYYDTCSDIADRMSDNKEWRKRGEDGNFLVDENGNYIPDENYRCATPEDVDAALKEAYQTPEGERTADQVQLITIFEAAAKQMSNSVPTVRDLAQMVCDIYGISVDQLERASNLEPSSRRKGNKATQAMALFNDLLNRGVTTSGKPVGRVKLKHAETGDAFIEVYNEANPANKDGYYFYKDATGQTRWLPANEVESYEPIMNESERRYKVSNDNAKATLDRIIDTYTKEASLYNDELLDMRINNLLEKYDLKLDEEGNILRKEGAKRGEADIDENGMRTDDADLLKLQTFLKVRQDRAAAKQGEDNMRNLRSERERAEAVRDWGEQNGVTYDVDYLIEHPLELDELVKKMESGETAELNSGQGTVTEDNIVASHGDMNADNAAQYKTTPTTDDATKTAPTSIEAGGRYNVVDEQNTQHEVEVLRDNGNGTVEVRVDGAEDSIPMAKEQLAAMLGVDVALTTPQTEPPATTTKLEQPAPVATNEMKEADVDAGETGLSLREKAGAYVDAYFPDVKGDEREGFIEQLVAQNDFENTIRFDKEDGVNLDRVAKYEQRLAELEKERAASDSKEDSDDSGEAVEPYRIDEAADPDAIAEAGFSEDNLAATVDYLNGKIDERAYLERLGFDKDVLAGIDDDKVNKWVEGVANRASEFLTDKPAESDEVPADAGTTSTPTPQPEAADATKEVEATPEPMPMREVKSGKTTETEPDWQAVSPERGREWLFNESGLDNADANEIVNNNLEAAQKAVDKASKLKPKKTTNPLVLQSERKRIADEQASAQSVLDYWKKVKAIEQDRQAQAAAERKAKDAEVAAQAQAEEQARQAAELAKQQEQAERGAGAVHPAIAEKWGNAPKVEGYDNEITLANGEKIQGRYVLTESGAATPSHNALREFEKSEGFPVDENGNTVNDRDYERDKDAQNITRKMGDTYDGRAIQQVPVVSKDGVVLSGNGRTMAGELAASNNTDKAYIDHLKKYGKQFGFSPEQVSSMQHPRVVFVPDADMPYTTDTFAKFNEQEMKGQSKTEQAVKLGKVVDDATFNQIVRAINDHETLGDFYNNTKAATEAINALRRAGALNEMQYAEMFDGDAVSGTGRQIIENMLIGKAFEGNPDVIRQLTEIKSLRQSVVTALNEITTNKALGKEYSLEKELAQAVDLAYKARKAGYKENEPVSPYATQLNLFPFEDGETVADYNNVAVLELADLMNDKRPTQLKKKLQDYNQQSAESAAGQMDIFSGGVKEKKEIIKTVLNTLHNGETEEASRPEQRGSVADERGGEASLQENGAADTGSAALATPQAEPSIDAAIVEAGKETNTEPTDAQKEAGNYKKGHVKIDGFDISIEQPKGSVRSGVDDSGKPWSQTMNNTYGYIRGTEGVDGDHIDVFLSDNLDGWNGTVYVVDQVEKGGIFDEHKVMYGFNSEAEARKAYLSNYEDGWQGLGAITPVSKEEFKKWVDSSHRKTKPFAEYKNVKVEETQEQEPKQQGTLFPATEQQPSSKSETKPRTTEKQPAEAPKERIDDVGEKIEGAKKDLAKKMGERINLDADTFPKMFPKYDLKKLISQGLDPNLAVMTKMLRQMAQADYKHYSKKRMYGKSYALRAARFYAAYAKQVLEAGDSNVDFKSEGLGFTDYGKQFVELNKRLFEELYNKLGDDLFDLDLAGVKIQPLSQKEGSTWFRRNQETGEMEPYNPAYAFVGPRGQNYYEANELDKALQEGVEQLTKSIDYKKAHPYKLGHYYKPGIKNSDYVGVKLGGKIVPLTEPMTSSEVRKYMSEHNAELQAKAAQLDEQRKLDKKKGGTGEGRWKPELTLGGGRPRVGVDRRGGVDVEPEEFRKAFSFRGVQFGNYVTQRERQRFLNEAYDALMDMAELLGISPRAIAIDGRLGFAIGARGGGKANAHYEPKENVINLTKSKGAGSLAHEWFHALDYYFNRGNKKPTASTANKSAEQFPASTRNEMRKAFLDLMSAIKNSDYFKRSENLEMKLRSGKLEEGYYDKPTELAARAFQDYVVRKLADKGKINDFLSSFTSEEEWNGEPENYPFPIGAEAEKIDEKFDALFDAMQERTDEEGNTILYHLGKEHDVLTDTEIALRDGLVDVMRSVGIDVETDEVKGQKVLDNARRAVELLDEMKKKSAPETAPLTNTGGSSADISSADGAKILQNIETLAKKYENISNYRKNFLDELAVAIGAKEEPTKKKKKDEVTSNSKYATFKTLAGTEVTIRLANHNATVSNFDNNGEQEGISIVISKRANQGITNNGNAHIVEFFYPEIGLRKAEGKPLVEIILSLGQALRSGEYKDTTGLATPQEVNGTMLQEMRGWHGSAAEFDEFDHSHMSEGEGNQAIGYGTYIASIEEIGRYYGTVAAMQKRFRAAPGYGDYDHYWKGQKIDLSSINPLRMAYDIVQREGTIKKAITMVEKFVDNPEAHEGWRSALDILRESRKSDFKRKRANYEGERYLYEVDIPENDGTNYLPWDEPLSDAMRERIAQGLRDMGVDLNEPFERRSGKADNFDFLDEQMSEHPITGQELYYKLVDRFGRYPQQASEFLNKYCGLVGIEYPSNFFSGGNKKGLKNHVIFNEKDIKIDNRTQYFISADGVVYGFVKDGKIYIDPKVATAETPIHEYCHLWGDALKEANPEAWERLKETMLGEKDVLDYVKKMYPGLEGDALVSEVFSRYSGRRGAERLRADMEREMKNAEGVFAKARVARIFDIIKRALSRFWTMARDLFAGKTRGLDRLTAEDFADMAMSDLLRGFNPRKKVSGETFYSNAERAVENIKQNKATAEQWQAMIKKDGGLKAGEDRWMGLSDWLAENKGKSLTKNEVLNFIRENGIEMVETHYNEGLSDTQRKKMDELQDEFDDIKNNFGKYHDEADTRLGEFISEMQEKYGEDWPIHMNSRENALETKLQFERDRFTNDEFETDDIAFDIMRERYGDDFALGFEVSNGELAPIDDMYGNTTLNEYAAYYLGDESKNINTMRLNHTTQGLENNKEIAFVTPEVEPYRESDEVHFGPENEGKAVMWVRYGETTDADGNRVLVIDEIQSNRHQDARERGYVSKGETLNLRNATNVAQENYDAFTQQMKDKYNGDYADIYANDMTDAEREHADKLEQEVYTTSDAYEQTANRIPAAPFEKNWHEVAMKRMLRLAAEEGFDKVAWTTGKQQAERYSLEGKVDRLVAYEDKNGELDARAIFPDGTYTTIGKTWDEVGRYVGKSVAQQLRNSADTENVHWGYDANMRPLNYDYKLLKADNITVGGEGMKGFYDNILPRFMDKYGKKWGVKTGTVELPNVEEAGRTMHSVDVTPAMRASVMSGQPMFQKAAPNDNFEDVPGVNKEHDEYVSVKEVEDYLATLPNAYNVHGVVEAHPINSLESLEALKPILDQELYDEIKKRIYHPNVYGCRDSKTGMVFVFTHKIWTLNHAEHNWWHENSHGAYDALELADKEDCGREALDWLLRHGHMSQDAYNHYKDNERGTEGAARLITYIFDNYGVDGILNKNFDGNEKIAKLATAIQNYYKYGETRENKGVNLLRQGQSQAEPRTREDAINAPGRDRQGTIRPESSRRTKEEVGGTQRGTSIIDEVNERSSSYRNSNGDVIPFESHAEQLSLFGGVEQSNKRVIEQAKRDERAKAVAAMSDAELLKEMQRDIAEFEKLGRGDWGIQTACTDEYDRRHIKEYNAECERVHTMLDENNVSIEEAEDMLCNAIYSWRDGYATADRSKLLAQFDTLNDYYAEKTDERDNADLYQEVESKQAISEADARNTETPTQQEVAPTTQQTEPAKPKKAAFDPSAIKLRKLKSGETCHVERRYQESGGFDFTGSEIIKDDADLAYIFRNLENSAIENTFLVLIKNGKATILHTGMGSYAASVGHVGAGLLAASKLKPDHVIFVHNHPSGRLEPSVQDVAMQTRAKKMFGEGVVREAIIIDITSGEYCTFDDGPYTNTEVKKRPTEVENEIPYKTYSFSQYVFDKNYKPGTTMQITDANKAAAFISSHRLGERDKMSLIVMSRSKYVTANVFLPWTTLDGVDIEKAATTIAKYIHQMGGESGIVYGSATIDRNILDPLSREIERREVHLDDFITVEGRSAQQEGVLEDEVLYEAVPRNTEQHPTEVAEDGVGYGEADDSGISDEELAGYDAGRYSFAESITQGLVDLALKNTHDQQLRLNAMREFGGNLAKLRKIMNKQKAYDKGTVDDIVRLARMVMGSGFFKDMSAYEVKRLLAAIKKGVGAEDLTPIANNVVDMLVQHQLRESKNMLHKLMQVRGRKVDARGVEVQAGLDIDGQRMMSALKDGMSLGENGLLTRINDCENRLGSEDEVIRKNAMSEYQGLMLAKEYHDNILSGEEEEIVLRNEKRQEQEKIYDFRREPVLDDDGNAIINQDGSVRTVERKTLKPQFKNNVTDENKQLRRNTEAAIERIEQSIRESRMERVTSYIDFMSDVAGDVRASRERAAEWRAEQQQRVDEIHHNANSDLEGVPVQSQVKLPEGGLLAFNSNNDIVRLLFQPLATFEKMLRFFGRKAHNGEGYLFNRFMRGWVDCSDKEWRSKRAAHEELDAKVNELFGKKAKRWSDLYKVERNKKHPGIPVEYWDNGERVQETMSQGEALSLVVWSKQKDAEAGLRRMGISEEDIETIKNNLDPKFLQLAEWVVEEFLPKRREYYNEVHERMFGAPMAAIEHYFPIVRNSRDVEKPSDITERDLGETKPSTITGNIIKRQRTAATLDVHTDFFDHLLKHLDDMENWAAWAEFNRDINTLRNYKRFKNRVLNMHSVEYGSGKDLWKAFDDACAIAAGVYHPSTKRGSGDNLAVNIAKGVTGAKIAFRFYTAAKQLLSLPAFWNGDAGLKELAKWENPVGAIIAWNWAMKNLPGFSKRWQSRQVGDVRLMDTDSDYAFWRNNMVRALRRGGMWANALVDGMTVAMGARAVYETKKKRYLRNGYSEEQAEKRAMQDAAISYNSSQQSSEDAFLSSLQLDRTWWSTLMTVFRSASMGYQRRLTTGLRNLKNRTKKGYKAESIAFMKKQMERDGVDEATAEKAAKRTYRWGGLRSMADVFVYGFVLPFFWNLGPYALYLLMGDDDDEKKDMLKDASVHSLFGPIEGLTGGNAMSEIGNTYAGYLMSDNDKSLLNALRYHDYLSMPLGSDLQQIFNEAGNDSMAAWTDAFNLLVQAGIGINPETFTDTWVAIADACDGDPQTTKEFALCFMRVMQVPQTQTDKLFIDELGMTAKDAQKLNAMEMADRFARYKKFRNAPLLNWAYSPDESQKVAEKYRKRFLDNMQERMEHMDDEQLGWNFENPNDSERRKAVGKVYAKGKGVQDSAGKKPASNWKPETRRSQLKYQRLRDYNDLAEDVLLDVAIDQAKNRGDGETEKALRDAKKELTEIKRGKHTKAIDINGLGDGSADDDKAIMEELRARRKEILQEYGIIQ